MSWLAKSSICSKCKDVLVVSERTTFSYCDYWWYCSNKTCENHNGEQLGDQEAPSFYEYKKKE